MSPTLKALANRARALIGRAAATQAAVRIRSADELNPYGPLLASREMRIREADSNLANYNPEDGVIDPKHINQVAMFVLFGFIGAAFVVGGIWFFFWAKNGGFTYHENDWDDYVSTVLRRKGPNGTILSNVTKSTKLGGGSVYHDYEYANRHDDERTEITDGTGLSGSTISGITAGASDLAARAERKRKIERRKREKKAAKNKKRSGGTGEENSLIEEIEAEADAHLREYRAERPARVGGLNREADGSEWEGSTIPSESNVSASLLDHQQPAPMNSPEKKKAPGIRKVYSTADRNKRSEEERMKAEARRINRQSRAAAATATAATSSSAPGLRGGASDISGVSSSTMTASSVSVSDGLRRSYTSQRASGVPRSRSQRRSRPENTGIVRSAISEVDEPSRPGAPSDVGTSTISGTSTAQTDNTKSYYHPIPELRAQSQKRASQPPITRDPSRRRRESQERGESSTRRRESRDREGSARRRESRDRDARSEGERKRSQSRHGRPEDRAAAREERRKSRASAYRRGPQSDYDDVD
ncbi:hypothetical protein TD95_004971 [Thielaviopsis punctulata]|uniref:Endosomal spry domain-containing protein n=1 Tax=Thielaviopsis punctulata TaxID=72032 RepID=A0A0F4ZK88_9PEZI|nr:hypothetical protein TD95_004971 [Thielaviopsis punctulata]